MITYLTIANKSEGIYRAKGSRFLSFVHPVETIEQVEQLLEQYRTEYRDARHVCYAYMLGADRKTFRANDDGEPSGTAGRPILGQINSLQLTNVLVVVVRYFGGILLGTGGLIVAYKEAAQDALSKQQPIDKEVRETLQIRFGYEQTSAINRTLNQLGALILTQQFTADCQMTISIAADRKAEAEEKLAAVLLINESQINHNK